ncbi:hypothetical protein BREVNS_0265 [Brevinematales bacterium NS]|nr:hypothetical protein BREVNS_0265 [Brevinematales bacterium NS]
MQGGFLALFRSGAMPLFPVFSVYRGLFVFSIQKNRIIDYEKKYFYTMRPLHGCFLPLFGSGATPLSPDFSISKGWFVFFIQKKSVYLLRQGTF